MYVLYSKAEQIGNDRLAKRGVWRLQLQSLGKGGGVWSEAVGLEGWSWWKMNHGCQMTDGAGSSVTGRGSGGTVSGGSFNSGRLGDGAKFESYCRIERQ